MIVLLHFGVEMLLYIFTTLILPPLCYIVAVFSEACVARLPSAVQRLAGCLQAYTWKEPEVLKAEPPRGTASVSAFR